MPKSPARIHATLLAFCLLVAAIAVSTTTAATASAQTVDGFVSQWNGKSMDFDGAYGAQCVDLFNFYNRDVVGAPRVGVTYAYQLFDSAPSSHYTKLGADAAPTKGDVAVWGSSLPNGSGGAGHVAVVMGTSGANLSIFTQNPGAAHVTTMSKSHLRGYLRPKNLAPASHNPQGTIDGVSSPAPGVVAVRGWAFDRDNPSASVDIHVYVGGEAGAADVDGLPIRADVSRPDVNSAHGITGNHGFDTRIETRRSGNLPVCLYAINIGGGGNTLLGCRTIAIANPHPVGALDEATSPLPGIVKVRGWTFDPNESGKSINVHIYIGPGPGQTGSKADQLVADKTREDVNRTHGITGKHGFEATLTTPLRGSQQVCAFAINVGPGNTNPAVGCKTVTITGGQTSPDETGSSAGDLELGNLLPN